MSLDQILFHSNTVQEETVYMDLIDTTAAIEINIAHLLIERNYCWTTRKLVIISLKLSRFLPKPYQFVCSLLSICCDSWTISSNVTGMKFIHRKCLFSLMFMIIFICRNICKTLQIWFACRFDKLETGEYPSVNQILEWHKHNGFNFIENDISSDCTEMYGYETIE